MRRIVAFVAVWALIGLVALPRVARAGDEPGDVVSRFQAAYRAGAVDAMLEIYAADAVFDDVNQRHHFEGTEQLRALLTRIVAMHHRIDLRETRRVVQGNLVVVDYEYAGFLNGAILGQAVGKQGCPDLEYTLPTTSWYEIRDGRIVHQKDFIDMATLLEVRETLLAGGTSSASNDP